jgi:hypothetical protein
MVAHARRRSVRSAFMMSVNTKTVSHWRESVAPVVWVLSPSDKRRNRRLTHSPPETATRPTGSYPEKMCSKIAAPTNEVLVLFDWGKEKPKPPTADIRETLFGDMPLSWWASFSTQTTSEPWASFELARHLIESGDTQSATATLQGILEIAGLESRHYLQAYHFLAELGVSNSSAIEECPRRRGRSRNEWRYRPRCGIHRPSRAILQLLRCGVRLGKAE